MSIGTPRELLIEIRRLVCASNAGCLGEARGLSPGEDESSWSQSIEDVILGVLDDYETRRPAPVLADQKTSS